MSRFIPGADILLNEPEEPRYTLEEAKALIREQECSVQGHDYQFITAWAGADPYKMLCGHCGRSWDLIRHGSDIELDSSDHREIRISFPNGTVYFFKGNDVSVLTMGEPK